MTTKELLIHEVQTLSESLAEQVLDYLQYLKMKKNKVSDEEIHNNWLVTELKQLSRDEEKHLEKEFANYEQLYPRE